MTVNQEEPADVHAEQELARWISLYQQVTLPNSDESWVHRSFANLVSTHGRFFRAAPWPVPGAHPRRQGECFRAANEWADRNSWTYVEGFAFIPSAVAFHRVFDHAWCLTQDGRVADPALEDGLATGYVGISVADDFRHRQRALRGTDALFTADPTNVLAGYATNIFRHGIPSEALTLP